MSLDLIKSYLVGIGFKIDNSSLNNAQQKMNDAERSVKSFAKNNSSSVASMQNATSDIGTLARTSFGALARIFPGMKGPLNEVMNNINLVKQVFNAFSKSVKQDMNDADKSVNNFQSGTHKKANSVKNKVNNSTSNEPKSTPAKFSKDILNTTSSKNNSSIEPLNDKLIGSSTKDMSKNLTTTSKSFNYLSESSGKTETSLESFSTGGSTAIEGFSVASLAPLALVAAGIAGIAIAGVALTKFLGNLAKQDLGYQMLARQLWTTKENAKEIDMALKTMGVTLQDLWLSPQLLAQFNQLRKDSAELKLPDSFNKNILVVQELGFEFQRTKQAGTLAMQWIGSYILQYLAGPLVTVKNALHNFNEQLLKDIPGIAKVIGGVIGTIVRLFLVFGEALGVVGKLAGDVFNTIGYYLNTIPKPLKDIIAIITLINVAIAMGPLSILIALILVFDDLMTGIKGGKSVIFDVFGGFGKAVKGVETPFKNLGKAAKTVFDNIKKWVLNIFDKPKEALVYLGKLIADIGKKINSVLQPIATEIKKLMADIKQLGKDVANIKNVPGNVVSAAKKLPGNIMSSVQSLFKQQSVNYTVPASSSTKNTNSTNNSVANSNNKSSNTNTFNVYSTSPTSTASAIGKTLTGINIHNLQGVY